MKVGDKTFIRKQPKKPAKRALEAAMTESVSKTTDTASDTGRRPLTSGFHSVPLAQRAPPAPGAPEVELDNVDLSGTVAQLSRF